MLPRIVGQGRAAELLFTGRSMGGYEAYHWGFYNRLCPHDTLVEEAHAMARELAQGPTRAHAMTKKMLHAEWNMGVDEAIDAEARAQAALMTTRDFKRAYEAFAAKRKPVFEGD
jgi:enoyl-CoA hydratase/carnithine racemase